MTILDETTPASSRERNRVGFCIFCETDTQTDQYDLCAHCATAIEMEAAANQFVRMRSAFREIGEALKGESK